MSILLLEIGVEELPVSFMHHGLGELEKHMRAGLTGARLEFESLEVMGTPRRLSVIVKGLAESQADRDEEIVGPPWSVAFRDDAWTKAAEGFARKNGVELDALKKVSLEKGDYLAAQVFEKGQKAAALLGELLANATDAIGFPKSMRWASQDKAFGRPVQWLAALLDGEVISFDFAGVSSGRQSRGHRFLSSEVFDLDHAQNYIAVMRECFVQVLPDERRNSMRQSLEEAAEKLGGVIVEDDFLENECASLVEWPFVVPGGFEEEFLALPDAVTISVMRDHQRYLALRDKDGKLLPAYLNVVNTAEAPETIAKGNDRVLRARLKDAAFFVEEDRKRTLASRLEKLNTVVFQKRLGSVGDKIRRFSAIAASIAAKHELDLKMVEQASTLAKADLESLIVFEFPELQGEMGRYYAEIEGLSGEVCQAIEEHYWPIGASGALPSTKIAACVAIADRIDTLVGCFGVGLGPSGSADPFALRRAALGIVRIALEGPLDVDLGWLVDQAIAELSNVSLDQDQDALRTTVLDFFHARLQVFLKGDASADIVRATMAAWDGTSLRDLNLRTQAVAEFSKNSSFSVLATAFKRAQNITKEVVDTAFDVAKLDGEYEKSLLCALEGVEGSVSDAFDKQDYRSVLSQIASELEAPVTAFFDNVFVMDDDLEIRAARLGLLRRLVSSVERIAHFHELS